MEAADLPISSLQRHGLVDPMQNPFSGYGKRVGAHLSSALKLYVSRQTAVLSVHEFVQSLVPHDLGIPLIRVGGEKDGGYLLPDDLEGLQMCFSPGVGDSASFETAMLARGVRSCLADYSVDGPPASLTDCDFEKKYLGPVNSDHVISLDRWVSEKTNGLSDGDLILQMDIEGAEYETLLATSMETLQRFRIIVLELHKLHHLDNPLYFRTVNAAVCKLREQFEVAHVHPNNAAGLTRIAGLEIPRVMEVTLLRKDRVVSKAPVNVLPHPLDIPNVADRKDVLLPEYWWNSRAHRRAA